MPIYEPPSQRRSLAPSQIAKRKQEGDYCEDEWTHKPVSTGPLLYIWSRGVNVGVLLDLCHTFLNLPLDIVSNRKVSVYFSL